MSKSFDVAVIGAGVFGVWTAWHLQRSGLSVLLVDQYGPANARASSGGDTRVIRMAYGADAIYTRMAQQSLLRWKDFFARIAQPDLFRETGVLWLADADDAAAKQSVLVPHLRSCCPLWSSVGNSGASYEHCWAFLARSCWQSPRTTPTTSFIGLPTIRTPRICPKGRKSPLPGSD